ncbi:MAG: hypothetical protein P8L78_08890 [Mariniblastus sp.]|nr:hypothetical protein [Mariniblastus sp.]MDG2181793.1 hypothetical protein [Mariniblastus sp.]
MNETPLIQQYLQFRSEFMGYLYAITRDPNLSSPYTRVELSESQPTAARDSYK